MKTLMLFIFTILLGIFGFIGVVATEQRSVVVENAWSRASIGMKRPGVVYMTIKNLDEDTKILTDFHTDIAQKAEIHRTRLSQGVVYMSPVREIEIGPGETIALKPGNFHIMLMHLQRPLVEGSTFPMTLIFSDSSEIVTEIPVLAMASRGLKN